MTYQFLIGNVRHADADDKELVSEVKYQFLIGNVRQQYLSAVSIIIP